MQRKDFLNDLKRGREKELEDNRKRRAIKKNQLNETHTQLYGTEGSKSLYDEYDSIAELINETEERIPAMEENLRKLKSKHSSKAFKSSSTLAMKKFKLDHRENVKIAEWIIRIILDKVKEETSALSHTQDTGVLVTLLQSDKQQFDQLQKNTERFEAKLEVMEKLIDEVVEEFVFATSDEVLYLSKMSNVLTHNLIMNSSEAAVKGKDKTDNAVEQAWLSLINQRERLRKHIWSHTQPTVSSQPVLIDDVPDTRQTKRTIVTAAPQAAAEDLEIVSSEEASFTIESKYGRSPAMLRYGKKEREWWNALTLQKSPVKLISQHSVSITFMKLTADHQLLAVGTGKGDILVYDLTWKPFRLTRCVVYSAKKPDPITNMSWSLDKSRLLTLSAKGCVILWSVSFTLGYSDIDLNKLEINVDKNFRPSQLTCLCVLENEIGDFLFKEGPLSETETSGSIITDVLFDKAMSLAATQDHIIVVMQNGDLLRCDLSKQIEKRFREQLLLGFGNAPSPSELINGSRVSVETMNKISQGIPCELFRWHRTPIIIVSFLKEKMITIDSSLKVCTWNHNSDNLNSFGWFTPVTKFKLLFAEELLINQEKDKVIFEDERVTQPGIGKRRKKTKQTVERERLAILRELRGLNVLQSEPWHTDEFPDKLENDSKSKNTSKLITRIYAPSDEFLSDTVAGGATFYVVTFRRKDELLVKCATRLYELGSQLDIKILKYSMSPYNDRVYFMLLFNEHLPKVRRHIAIIDFDMQELKLGGNCSIKIDLSTEDFNRCSQPGSVSFSVSRTNSYSGTAYISCIVNKKFYVYSARSGQKFVELAPIKPPTKKEDVFAGVSINSNFRDYVEGRKMIFTNSNGMHFNILFAPSPFGAYPANPVQTLVFKHTVSTELKLSLQAAYENALALKATSEYGNDVDDDSRSDFSYELSYTDGSFSHRNLPLPLYIHMMLYRILDVVIARSTGLKMNQDTRRKL